MSPKFADPEKLTPAPAEVYRFLFPHHFRYHQTTTNHQALVMAFVDITEDNISELIKSKDGKSTQRAVTRSIKLFRDFFIHKNEPGEFETYTKPKTGWDVETFLCINQKNRWWNDEKKFSKRLGAIKVKIGPTSDIDKIFSKMYSQYVLFRNKYS